MEYLAFRKLNYIVSLKSEKKNFLNYDSHWMVWSRARSRLGSAETSTVLLPSSVSCQWVFRCSWPLSLGKNFCEAQISIFGIYRPKRAIKCHTVKQAYSDEIAIIQQRKKWVSTSYWHTLLTLETTAFSLVKCIILPAYFYHWEIWP